MTSLYLLLIVINKNSISPIPSILKSPNSPKSKAFKHKTSLNRLINLSIPFISQEKLYQTAGALIKKEKLYSKSNLH